MDCNSSFVTPSRRADLRTELTMTRGSTTRGITDYKKESYITLGSVAITLLAWVVVTGETAGILWDRFQAGEIGASLEQVVFIAIIQALIYGNLFYQFARLGYLRRRLAHRPLSAEEREALDDRDLPALAILVPSYREEVSVVRRALLSAALQDYPRRRVVLLLDDPPDAQSAADRAALESMRRLPDALQVMLNFAAEPFARAQETFLRRVSNGHLSPEMEAGALARLYELAAASIESIGRGYSVTDHVDRLFLDCVLMRAAKAHRERGYALVSLGGTGLLSRARIEHEYRRLASLFRVEVTSFERKRYVNLSHEPNKAMNLNSYIGLLGRSWQEVCLSNGLHLEPARPACASLIVPAADYLVTLDADSILVPEYAIVLINEMLRPGSERLAVAQTPYNTIPNAPGLLERIAGATTDIQYLIHQGFTHFDATYWVGANALLRVAALQDIRHTVSERGFEVPVFIQDRTVIEDTESSVDLVSRGWKLFNYPERLAFSATPPDFGSLLIQRRRWANGGLIIMPKLVRYLTARPYRLIKLCEGFFRIHYLVSITLVSIGLLILLGHGFEQSIRSPWLPLTALPYFFLYSRDLCYSGYRITDLPRVYALNLLLIPVNLGGVFRSLHQLATGRRTPFGRTPKVSGRTAAPMLYVLAEYALLASWLVGVSMDVAAGRWINALFCLANALMLGYAIKSFIGFRESWEDLRLTLPIRGRLAATAAFAPGASDSPRPATKTVGIVLLPPPAVTDKVRRPLKSPPWKPATTSQVGSVVLYAGRQGPVSGHRLGGARASGKRNGTWL